MITRKETMALIAGGALIWYLKDNDSPVDTNMDGVKDSNDKFWLIAIAFALYLYMN
jgi:hypothetical protein